jgi:uncharacterized protein (TIGR02266 family)
VVDRVVVRPRRDPTLPEAALDFRLDLEFHDESQFFVGMSGDVAKGGLFVATYKTLPVGTHVALEMSLTDGTELRVDGVVDWLRDQREAASERPGMGVAFNDLSEDAHAALDRVCGQREPLYFEAE